MEKVAAYIMLTMAEKKVTMDSMQKLFSSIDAAFEEEIMEEFLSLVKDKSIDDIRSKGMELMCSLAAAAPAKASAAAEPAKEEKKEEKKEEEEIEIDLFADF
jgi:large subunit ribosomal protein L12